MFKTLNVTIAATIILSGTLFFQRNKLQLCTTYKSSFSSLYLGAALPATYAKRAEQNPDFHQDMGAFLAKKTINRKNHQNHTTQSHNYCNSNIYTVENGSINYHNNIHSDILKTFQEAVGQLLNSNAFWLGYNKESCTDKTKYFVTGAEKNATYAILQSRKNSTINQNL